MAPINYLTQIVKKYLSPILRRETPLQTNEPFKINTVESPDYASLMEHTAQGNTDLDTYVRKVAEEMRLFDSIDVRGIDPLKPIMDKVNSVLAKYAGMNFKEFAKEANPWEFNEGGYATMPNKPLRYRLFEYRSQFHLAAIYDCEQMGIDIGKLLIEVRAHEIPFIKNTVKEPTFEAILRVMGLNQ